jgi:hypothetical protein
VVLRKKKVRRGKKINMTLFLRQEAAMAMVGIVLLSSSRDRSIQAAAGVLLLVCFLLHAVRMKSNRFRTHLVSSDEMNEALVVEGLVSGKEYLFLIDTGYAGPPVLSVSYLSCREKEKGTSVEERYFSSVGNAEGLGEEGVVAALSSFLKRGCISYTSGCTMRLMGIGSVEEQQADMFLCDMLKMRTVSGFGGVGHFSAPKRTSTSSQGDVFVTNELPKSVHILTCDFLLHSSPCVLLNEKREMLLNLPPDQDMIWRRRMTPLPFFMHGGSFVVPILVEGVTLHCTLDTGAPAPLSLSSSSSSKLSGKKKEKKSTLFQTGANGERVESSLFDASVSFGGEEVETTYLLNSSESQGVDGYIGIGILRGFDIFLSRSYVGVRKNGNRISRW